MGLGLVRGWVCVGDTMAYEGEIGRGGPISNIKTVFDGWLLDSK